MSKKITKFLKNQICCLFKKKLFNCRNLKKNVNFYSFSYLRFMNSVAFLISSISSKTSFLCVLTQMTHALHTYISVSNL